MFADLALVALVIEAMVGYPDGLYRLVGHPVTWIGRLIAWCDRTWNSPGRSDEARRALGLLTLLLLLALSLAVGCAATLIVVRLFPHPIALLLTAMLGSSLLAQRSLDAHVRAVAAALEQHGLDAGRRAVAHIVGRDTTALDEAAVCRAAIESLAENFSDGVVAPAFWMVVTGLPGALAYKAVNTADSMIGHKTARHRAFGWASARCDDLINLPASRLAALWLVLAAALLGCSSRTALAVLWRDARHHRSPNAGWPEAAMAGALGVRLSGPRVYDGEPVAEPWIGNGRCDLGPADIRAALRLYRAACAIQAAALLLLIFAGGAPLQWRVPI
ncbi:MAG: cobalamin biosynthesis protein CobD [Alphaproteobacteria bacterium]|nr:cobalamin biosynthesis protein CobD [Alphaproteobacteria bacterium]